MLIARDQDLHVVNVLAKLVNTFISMNQKNSLLSETEFDLLKNMATINIQKNEIKIFFAFDRQLTRMYQLRIALICLKIMLLYVSHLLAFTIIRFAKVMNFFKIYIHMNREAGY